nr:Uncharacterised protein [Klebsiella pneumoniae]
MVRSRTGQRKTSDRTLQHGSPASGSDFLTLFSPLRIITTLAGYAVRVAATRCQFYRQAMAYKEAKPQSFVRIVVSMLTRVM